MASQNNSDRSQPMRLAHASFSSNVSLLCDQSPTPMDWGRLHDDGEGASTRLQLARSGREAPWRSRAATLVRSAHRGPHYPVLVAPGVTVWTRDRSSSSWGVGGSGSSR
jgi:hypothetical protein